MEWMPVINPLQGGYSPGFDSKRAYWFNRDGWEKPARLRLCDQGDYFNVIGLYYAEIERPKLVVS